MFLVSQVDVLSNPAKCHRPMQARDKRADLMLMEGAESSSDLPERGPRFGASKKTKCLIACEYVDPSGWHTFDRMFPASEDDVLPDPMMCYSPIETQYKRLTRVPKEGRELNDTP
jgi:hypothetical protein